MPTRNSLFYLAATYVEIDNIEKAKATLAEAVSMSSLTIEGFIDTQNYKKKDQSSSLLGILKSIAT